MLVMCFLCLHDEIKKGVCDIITQICRADPMCGELFEDYDIIGALIKTIDGHPDEDFVSKALDALIGI